MARQPIKVTITYCAACGYERQALELAGVLLRELRAELSAVTLVPWFDGSFDVVVGDVLVHSMLREGGFPEGLDIVQALRERPEVR